MNPLFYKQLVRRLSLLLTSLLACILLIGVFLLSYKSFNEIILDPDLAAVKMEVSRNDDLNTDFLKHVRQMTKNNNVALIFDECTSGFRQALGGIHKVFEINPDILILGKALGNGYAINAILGKQEMMTMSDQTFMSSTFWSEQIGFTAGLKTLEVMKNEKSWQYISELGDYVTDKWRTIAKNNNLKISIKGLRSIPSFILSLKNAL